MTDLDSNNGFKTLVSQNDDDVEPARKKASSLLLYKAAIASLAILAAVLLIVDILLVIHYIKGGNTHRSIDDTESIKKELIKLEQSYKFAVRNLSDAEKKLESEMRRQTQSNWELDHHKRRTKDYEVQLDTILKNVSSLKLHLAHTENGCRHCPVGWILLNSMCYYFALSPLDGKKSWRHARHFCQIHGGDLITIDSIEEEIATMNYLRNRTGPSMNFYNFWIGLYFSKEGLWRWGDGRDLIEGYWADGESSDEVQEDCAALYSTENFFRAWISIHCTNVAKWICEQDPSPNHLRQYS
ncbi:CD209 antigen-like protein E isoform X2 [Syngnathus acus]|uniref:CD209 antigen-like protein E isoform X2 n=1 Tax=Syngnathus acus TaxID=161584 RepID=UPI001885C72B|nr:CD209 antigen-like protein E isoform X2 [Syngnathus acus]